MIATVPSIGEIIRTERERRSWSLRDLAARLGLSPETVRRWEAWGTFRWRGRRDTFEALCLILGTETLNGREPE